MLIASSYAGGISTVKPIHNISTVIPAQQFIEIFCPLIFAILCQMLTNRNIQARQWKIWSPRGTLGNDVAVFMREIGATRILQQWAFAHDDSLNSDERYDIPKRYEFLSLVKFDVWFCDSLVNLPDSKSIHLQNQRCHQCAHCEVVRFPDALWYCQCFSILFAAYSDQEPSNLCQEIIQ